MAFNDIEDGEIIIMEPFFPQYINFVKMAHAKITTVPLIFNEEE
jgi:aspartate/methionine/tyrosine aminotransferase